MKQLSKILIFQFTLVVLFAGSFAVPHGFAQTPGDKDPARWHAEDSTPEAKYQTAKKEAGAALQESLAECKTMNRPARDECMKEARSRFQAEMTEAKQQSAR